jgi:hypothetical protein
MYRLAEGLEQPPKPEAAKPKAKRSLAEEKSKRKA